MLIFVTYDLIYSNIHVNIWNSSKSKNPRITGLWHLLFRLLKHWNNFSLESCCYGDGSCNFRHNRFKTHLFQRNCRITLNMVEIWNIFDGPQLIYFIFYNQVRCCNLLLIKVFIQELVLGLVALDFNFETSWSRGDIIIQ